MFRIIKAVAAAFVIVVPMGHAAAEVTFETITVHGPSLVGNLCRNWAGAY